MTPIPDISVYTQFGIAGLILFSFMFLVMLMLTIHSKTIKGVVDRMSADKKESDEAWRMAFTEHSERSDKRQGETNEVLRGFTKIVAEINSNHEHIMRKVDIDYEQRLDLPRPHKR